MGGPSRPPGRHSDPVVAAGARGDLRRRILTWVGVLVVLLAASFGLFRLVTEPERIRSLSSIPISSPSSSGGVDAESTTRGPTAAPAANSGNSANRGGGGGNTNVDNPAVPVFGVDNPVWPAAPYVAAAVVRVTVSSTHPRGGSPIVVTISGVAAAQAVNVTISSNGATFVLGELHTDARGAAGATFTVPSEAAGASSLRVNDAVAGGSSVIAIVVISPTTAPAGSGSGEVGPGTGSTSSGPAAAPAGRASSGGVDAAAISDQGGIAGGNWGWNDTAVAAVAMLVFGLPVGGLALVFLGRRERPYRHRG